MIRKKFDCDGAVASHAGSASDAAACSPSGRRARRCGFRSQHQRRWQRAHGLCRAGCVQGKRPEAASDPDRLQRVAFGGTGPGTVHRGCRVRSDGLGPRSEPDVPVAPNVAAHPSRRERMRSGAASRRMPLLQEGPAPQPATATAALHQR